MSVGQSTIVSKWFRGQELALALGFNLSFSRLGSVFNGLILPKVYNSEHPDNLGLAFLIGFFVCIFSLLCALGLVYLDWKADKVDGTTTQAMSDDEKFKWSDLKSFKLAFWLLCASCVITYTAI